MRPASRFAPIGLAMLVCASADCDALSGRVVEEGTGKPMEGVMVVGEWHGHLEGFGEPKSTCYHLDTATTDAQGEFSMIKWSINLNPLLMYRGTTVRAYKPGYHLSDKPRPAGLYAMVPNSTDPQQRFTQIIPRLSFDCPDDELKKLAPVLKAIYQEAMLAAQTPQQRDLADEVLFGLERVTVGYDAAKYNQMARQRAQAEAEARAQIRESSERARAHPGSSIQITKISPDVSATLGVGDRVDLEVTVSYSFTADSGVVNLVVQAADDSVVSNNSHVVTNGSGSVTLKSTFVVPETRACTVSIAVPVPGTSAATVVDQRAFKVVSR